MPSVTPPIFIPGSGNVDRLLWIHEAAADKTKISGDEAACSPPRTARARTRVSMFELRSPLPKRLRVRLEQSAARHSHTGGDLDTRLAAADKNREVRPGA